MITSFSMSIATLTITKVMWKKEKDKIAALLAYRATALESLFRPDVLMVSRRPCSDLPSMPTVPQSAAGFPRHNWSLKVRQKPDFDQGKRARRLPDFEEGDVAWIKIDHKNQGRRGVMIQG